MVPLDRRADGFTERPATLLSLREFPASMDTGRHRRPWLEVRVELVQAQRPADAAPRELAFRLRAEEAEAYARVHRPGEPVPVWASADELMITPPLRLRRFEWFPLFHISVALVSFMLVLAVLAVRSEAARLYPAPVRVKRGRSPR